MAALESIENVFSNDMLRDIILEFTFLNDFQKVSPVDIKSCRLVQKSWMRSTSRIFRTWRMPLFHIHLNNYTSVPSVLETSTSNASLINALIKYFSGEFYMEETVPPIAFHFSKDFFLERNDSSFKTLLAVLKNSIYSLDFHFPKEGDSIAFSSPNFHLPNLQTFAFCFSNLLILQKFPPYIPYRPKLASGNDNNPNYLIQSILSSSRNLKRFKITESAPYLHNKYSPIGLKDLVLPLSITELDIGPKTRTNYLEILAEIDLSNLKKLRVAVPCGVLQNGVLTRILENVQKTLVKVEFIKFCSKCVVQPIIYFSFPKLEKLKWFTDNSFASQLTLEDNMNTLEKFLPELETLQLRGMTPLMLDKWTKSSVFELVTELGVSFRDKKSINLEWMEILDRAFPNVLKLSIAVYGDDASGILYIFRNMRRLKKLEIQLGRPHNDYIPDSSTWDALILGISKESASRLKRNPKLEPKIDDEIPSLRNLTDLEEFCLTGVFIEYDESLISDVVFHFAFLKMPKLKILNLHGPFSLMMSRIMEREWRAHLVR